MYQVLLDELIFEVDFKHIDLRDQKRIIKAIGKKLTIHPIDYGKPLRGSLKGYWKLRVGKYRVIYQIKEDSVLVYVIMVGYRRNSEVYVETAKRLGILK